MAEMSDHFHLFVYGTLQRSKNTGSLLRDCEFIACGTISGVLYHIDGEYPALVMYGAAPVEGEVWRCPVEKLAMIDTYERVNDGLFRRIGVEATVPDASKPIACWVYVAGPALGRKLVPARRITAWRR